MLEITFICVMISNCITRTLGVQDMLVHCQQMQQFESAATEETMDWVGEAGLVVEAEPGSVTGVHLEITE